MPRPPFARLALALARRPLVALAWASIAGIVVAPSGPWVLASFALAGLFRRRRTLAMVALGFGLGGWRINFESALPACHVARLPCSDGPHALHGEVVETLRDRCVVECRQFDGRQVCGKIQLHGVAPPFGPGAQLRILIDHVAEPAAPGVPGMSDFRIALQRRGIFRTAHAIDAHPLDEPPSWRARWWGVRLWIRSRMASALSEEAAGFLAGLLLGLDEDVSEALQDALRRTGTTHLLVISGMHFVLVYALAGFLARLVFFHRAWWIPALAWTFLYGILAVASVPVLRAIVMVVIHALSVAVRRRCDGLTVLALSALAVLALDPDDLYDPSFQLSFGAVLSILIVAPHLTALLPSSLHGWRHRLLEGAAITLACMLVASPIIAFHFHQFTPSAGISNLLLGPLFTLMLVLGFLSLVPGISLAIGPLADGAFALLKWLAIKLAMLPAASILVPSPSGPRLLFYFAALAAWLMCRRPCLVWPGAVILPFILVAPISAPEPVAASLPDETGWILLPGGDCGLIDPASRSTVVPYLLHQNIRRVHWILLTSPRPLDALLRQIPADMIIVGPGCSADLPAGPHLIRLDRNDGLQVGEVQIQCQGSQVSIRWRDLEWIRGSRDAGVPEASLLAGRIDPRQAPPGARLLPAGSWTRLDRVEVKKFK